VCFDDARHMPPARPTLKPFRSVSCSNLVVAGFISASLFVGGVGYLSLDRLSRSDNSQPYATRMNMNVETMQVVRCGCGTEWVEGCSVLCFCHAWQTQPGATGSEHIRSTRNRLTRLLSTRLDGLVATPTQLRERAHML
jgi:hypothetical protein